MITDSNLYKYSYVKIIKATKIFQSVRFKKGN